MSNFKSNVRAWKESKTCGGVKAKVKCYDSAGIHG